MKKVSIRQAIVDAIDETDPSANRYEAQMIKWAKYIEREIGSLNAYPRYAKLYEVTGHTIELPDNCLQVLAVIPGDYEDDVNAYYKTIEDSLIQTYETTVGENSTEMEFVLKPLNATFLNKLFWEQVGN